MPQKIANGGRARAGFVYYPLRLGEINCEIDDLRFQGDGGGEVMQCDGLLQIGIELRNGLVDR
jgi:hypothetical protein